jgi:ATP-dependent Clp protease ATP-binding subunit ClpA
MLSRNLEQSLHRALAHANERRHEYATLEHLLLALTEDQDAIAVLRACGVDLDKLRRDLGQYLDNELAGLVTSRGGEASKGKSSLPPTCASTLAWPRRRRAVSATART